MTKALLQLNNISLSYGAHKVIKDVELELNEGEIGCLLGSSGCGKTTLLRSIAGFEKPDKGEISLRNQMINDRQINTPPEQRNIGMVFQDFALFPHMSIKKNIAFGLLKQSKERVNQRVSELLELIGLADIADKFPHQLSGGQQQRVALARALAPKPDLLLLDEPFSSLDVTLREQLATEVRKIIKHEGISAILVTHDQQEAFDMADKVGLLHQGKMIQWDTPYNLYHRPASRYAANFIGQGVMLPGKVLTINSIKTELGIIYGTLPEGCRENTPVEILIRPDDIVHDDDSSYQLEITDKIFRGAEFLFTLKINDNSHVLCITPSHHNHAINSLLGIKLDITHSVIFKK
ncbi:MAG: ABC transporter ATP-binding protein [gamma proteobacterium symbiont of Bathyaustriella thionipta]|nr:ABC transporter ATP-binding protein [gamma proteobacterium symbiont of Bathyaustriella thionipta]MCU7948466.1 ABC transporter ATP-binding protein [gamma proteobacterium symbiont of Bathyaustriella thionipta]MCU7952462.1 ABC transporter ATP-binding protein [gamma proteobacterium symbiont of Bathyaustriella thionipta]MCU7955388.1 ABC transporter ATP-binding protein [gamma proteobacterium symbiont of Bathyaustriella thionipta]MCU7966216.1 ABC transporter ATP-binding protein [gamma proteobacteri